MCFWVSNLIFLCVSFFVCEIGRIISFYRVVRVKRVNEWKVFGIVFGIEWAFIGSLVNECVRLGFFRGF